MSKSSIVVMVIALIIIVAVIGYFSLNDRRIAQNSENNTTDQNTGSAPTPTESENSNASTNSTDDNAASETTIVYSDSGFFPKEVTVKKGSVVTFKNESSLKMWPASAKHPTHEVYPGSSITKCNTPAASAIFDACKGISRSESWSFTFNEVGSWAYHDHLKPTYFGKITVE